MINKELLINMPNKIYRDTYIKLDTYELVDINKVNSIVDNDVNEYFNNIEETYRNLVIDKLTKNLKEDFISKILLEYLNSSYLIKLKLNKDKDEVEDKKEENASLNKIIRAVIKDRPNDFDSVIERIKTQINSKEEIKEDFTDDSLEYELSEELEKEVKEDKLTKYINETVIRLKNTCYEDKKREYNEYYNKFIEDNLNKIDNDVNKYMEKIKKSDLQEYKRNRRLNIVNLFDFIFKGAYLDLIKWVDDGKYIIMVKTPLISMTNISFTSGTKVYDEVKYKLDKIKEIHRHGNMFTLVVEE